MNEKIEQLRSSIDGLYLEIFKKLSNIDKDIDIEFQGRNYLFGQVFTRDEWGQQGALKDKFIRKIMRYCIIRYLRNEEDPFNFINQLDTGINPKDFQVEKIDENDFFNISARNESGEIRSVPLDTDTIYVQSQRPDLNYSEFVEEWSNKLEKKDAKKDKDSSSSI